MDFDSIVRALSQPEAYSERPQQVEHIETHISHVFLTDRFAYKFKKPVQYDFLDYSTLALRREACESEVRLNRRLAKDVYLGVVAIAAGQRQQIVVEGRGAPLEWAVKMRRLARDRAMDELIQAGNLSDAQVEQAADVLSRFYRQLAPQDVAADVYRTSVEGHVRGNLDELLADVAENDLPAVRRIHTAQLRYLHAYAEELDRRVSDGRIVEGHGDLRPEHIYFAPQPTIIDCIEFNFDFRRLDVADELGFLDMELTRLGAAHVGETILDQYRQSSGDAIPAPLLDFYRSYRACVRAKVCALRAKQLSGSGRQATARQAKSYLSLANRYAARLGKPLLLVVRGLMGAGKSTLAARLADSLAVDHLETDALRRELFGQPIEASDYGAGRYSPENRRKVYDKMFSRAASQLGDGRSIVLDGVFLSADLRTRAVELARRLGADPLVIHCRCSDALALKRLAERASNGNSLSEGRPELLSSQKRDEEPDAPNTPSLEVDASQDAAQMLERVWSRIRELSQSS